MKKIRLKFWMKTIWHIWKRIRWKIWKRIRWNIWARANYGESGLFWSAKIIGKGDKSLFAKASRKTWNKIIVLEPLGSADTVFFLGFSDIFGNTKVLISPRKVGDGQFGMRMGPEDCEFFIVSLMAEVGLRVVCYIRRGNKKHADLFIS